MPRPGIEPGPPDFTARRADRYSTGALTKSQFPVFTIFAQKTCIRASCSRPWVFEVVRGNELRTYIRRRRRVGTRRECMELCLQEHEFTCRRDWLADNASSENRILEIGTLGNEEYRVPACYRTADLSL
ncbi:hypothetical protein ANN_18622 [Periplaneta americana]|uniref:Apple domain-containing protein n=1 Tax=Periplaneta americana TaxID=6978 RepID=A0ABQ8SPR0_PERAM|nr:hypothetical protein ANN_18622 [Periplaneta americana]